MSSFSISPKTTLGASCAPMFPARISQTAPLLAALMIVLTAVGGCAVGPQFELPAIPKGASYVERQFPDATVSSPVLGGQAQRFNYGVDVAADWWKLFQSPVITQLVDRALANNPTIPAAEAALRSARETVAAQRAAFLPSLSLALSPTRQKVATALAPPLTSGASVYSLHTAQLNIAYAVDVFDGNRRQVESLSAQADYQRFQLEAARITLTANVVSAVVQMALLRDQIDATESSIRLASEQLAILRKQLKLGAIAAVGVITQEALEAQTRALLPPLKKQLAQQQDLLAVLTGSAPNELAEVAVSLVDLNLPQDLPVSLPSKLVEQRPDVRAAAEQVQAASAQVGVAIVNMLPQLTLSGGLGGAATNVGDVLRSGAGFWSIAAGLVQPIFDGDALLHKKRSAEANHEQALAQYRGVVLSALQNVADVLHALRYDAEVLETTDATARATLAALKIARRQVELGDLSHLNLLTFEQAYQQNRLNLIQAQASRFSDTAALFQALGGGWWDRDPDRAVSASLPK